MMFIINKYFLPSRNKDASDIDKDERESKSSTILLLDAVYKKTIVHLTRCGSTKFIFWDIMDWAGFVVPLFTVDICAISREWSLAG